jgi:hypothetical protein
MDFLNVSTLAVMHDDYRMSRKQMRDLLAAVANGVVLSREVLRANSQDCDQLVAVVRLEDDRLFIRDGLHRATAIMLKRPSQSLLPEEFVIEELTSEMFQQANLSAGFYTPFDPQKEVRIADWSNYRLEVEHRLHEPEMALHFIEFHRSEYVRRRYLFHDSLLAFFNQKGTVYRGLQT